MAEARHEGFDCRGHPPVPFCGALGQEKGRAGDLLPEDIPVRQKMYLKIHMFMRQWAFFNPKNTRAYYRYFPDFAMRIADKASGDAFPAYRHETDEGAWQDKGRKQASFLQGNGELSHRGNGGLRHPDGPHHLLHLRPLLQETRRLRRVHIERTADQASLPRRDQEDIRTVRFKNKKQREAPLDGGAFLVRRTERG